MFSPTITQLTTTTTNHANNFNAINNVLIANDNFLKAQADDSANKIDVLSDEVNILEDKANWKPTNWKNENSLPSEYGNTSSTVFYSTSTWDGVGFVIVETHIFSRTLGIQKISDTTNYYAYRIIDSADNWAEWKTFATTDKTEILWEGSQSDPGEIQLSGTIHNKYNAFIITTGVGTTIMRYTYDGNDSLHIMASSGNALTFQTYTGVGRLIGVNDSNGLRVNLQVTGGQPLRSIIGIIKG